jgi:lysophospholipase L1-like esterase
MLSWLALGDSYTIGEGVAEGSRWTSRLAASLRREHLPLDDPRVIARTGWTTDELAAAMDAAEPLGQWDVVTLLIGVNNQYRGRPVAQYAREFAALLARAIKLARGRSDRVLVLSIPDWGVTPFAAAEGRDRTRIAQDLDACNNAARATCALHRVAFLDITGVSRALGGAPSMLAADGLHPSAAMHAEWAALALPVMRRLLQ